MKSLIRCRNLIRYAAASASVAFIFAVAHAPAHAQLLTGQTLQLDGYVPSLSNPAVFSFEFVANPGLDFSLNSQNAPSFIPVNIFTTDTTITLSYPTSDGNGSFATDPFNGYVFTDVNGTIPTFTNATVDPSTTLHGFGSGDLSFNANNIYVNVSGLSYSGGNTITIDLSSAGAASAPEPGSLPLLANSGLGLAFAGLCASRRKRVGQR